MMKSDGKRSRLREIIKVFIRHGIKKGLRGSVDPVNVRLAFEELGPTFVKIGQILSTHPDVVPPSYLKEFQKLQDSVRPEKFEDIKAVVEENLHCPLEQTFAHFEEQAMASASMAEVHKATLLSGEQVVVKVQRPEAEKMILSDISILKSLTRLFHIFPKRSFLDLGEILDEIEDNVKLELDFLNEAKNIKRFYENNKDVRYIGVPKVYEQYTTVHVLVMQYIEGIKIDDINALDDQGYDRHEIGVKLADNYFKQVFEDGFFHADPHPGNVMISENKIAYVDFGSMGNLDQAMLQKLNRLLRGISTNDMDEMTNSILQIGVYSDSLNIEDLKNDIGQIYIKYISSSFSGFNLSEAMNTIFKACIKNGIAIPKEMTMLDKGLMTLESILSKVSPEIDIVSIATSYSARHSFEEKDFKHELSELMKDIYLFSSSGFKIPSKLLHLIDTAQAGKLVVKIDEQAHREKIRSLSSIVNRAILGILDASFVLGSSIIFGASAGPKIRGMPVWAVGGFALAAILGLLLLISIFRSCRPK